MEWSVLRILLPRHPQQVLSFPSGVMHGQVSEGKIEMFFIANFVKFASRDLPTTTMTPGNTVQYTCYNTCTETSFSKISISFAHLSTYIYTTARTKRQTTQYYYCYYCCYYYCCCCYFRHES